MSINDEILKKAARLLDRGRTLAQLKMNARTLGHLADDLRRRPSFQNAYKVPEMMTDRLTDLQVSVDSSENKLNYERVPSSEMRKQIERTKVVVRMLPAKMTINGAEFPIILDEKVPDDEFVFVTGRLSKIIDWKTGRPIDVVESDR